MVKCVKVLIKQVNEFKSELIHNKNFNRNYKLLREGESVYLPVIKKYKNFKLFDKNLQRIEKELTFNDLLKNELSNKEIKNLRASFEVIGDVAILELGEDIEDKKKIIGDALLRSNKNFKSVLLKRGGHHGIFRIQGYEHLSGLHDYETLYKESGVSVKLDITKTYFSPRLATERLRIAKLVKPMETILVMFSGVGIYPFVIARHSKAKYILGVEINPDAADYAEENLKINKFKNIELRCGDIREEHIHGEFDRIIMPLPESSLLYLEYALRWIKKNGIIHLYTFSDEDKINELLDEINEKIKCKILNVVKCGQRGPRIYRYCVDIKVLE